VVGDVVLLEPGQEIPADGEVLVSVSLQVDEAKLTGEALPVAKRVLGDGAQCKGDYAYPVNMLLRSCIVADGHGTMRVTAVGNGTEIGKTAKLAAEEPEGMSPLDRQLERLSKLIGVVGFSIAAATFLALVVRGVRLGELAFAAHQWVVAAILAGTVLLALAKVWASIFLDAFELMGKELSLPGVLAEDGIANWVKLGLAAFLGGGLCIAGGIYFGFIPKAVDTWLPLDGLKELLQYFMIAVTIVVVAVPEGLPMSVTLSLAYSMRKMTAANNLVRRMHACETVGAATVICSDKTGTLTQNKMIINSVSFPSIKSQLIKGENSAEKVLLEAVAVNSTANIVNENGDVGFIGNPTEGATLLWLLENQVDYLKIRNEFKLKKQWTFTTESKMMGTFGVSGYGEENVLYVKGAPELLLERCNELLSPNGILSISSFIKQIKAELSDKQERGMRTLGFAFKAKVEFDSNVELLEAAENLVWLGFVAIADPIRTEVPLALSVCRDAGIDVKMVTGDNANTAWEIARQIGLVSDSYPRDQVEISGLEFQQLADDKALERVSQIKVLSRARPGDKLRLVKLLQQKNNVVAVTGDGTNDAPALNHADVGLAMGKTGTSVAKEASDIILLDDSFPSVVKGIMWGRSLYDNIQRFIMFQLTINVVALSIALSGPFMGIKLPLTVTQMLWINLIMDTLAALALATEAPHWNVMGRKPRQNEDFIITKPMAKHIFGVGFGFYLVLLALLKYFQIDGVVTDYELTAFFTLFVMLQVWNMFNARVLGLEKTSLKDLWSNKSFLLVFVGIIIMQFFIVQYGGKVFRTVPLDSKTWGLILSVTSLVFIVPEGVRRIFAKPSKNPVLTDTLFES
jgi:Ca2+-transporting ATPase